MRNPTAATTAPLVVALSLALQCPVKSYILTPEPVSRSKGPILLKSNHPRRHLLTAASASLSADHSYPLYNQNSNSFREDGFTHELSEVEREWGIDQHTQQQQQEATPTAAQTTPRIRKPMKTRDGAAIIAGTAVGGGFLALPSFTSPIGYLPTVLGLVSAWAFLVFSAIAFSEAAALQDDCAALEDISLSNSNSQNPAAAADNNNNKASSLSGTSVASVIQFAFGKKWALLAGGGFLAQMIAVMTANVVKGAELVAASTGMPYSIACIVPATLIGAFTFGGRTSSPETVEQVNTALTVMMVGGFATLIAATIGGGYTTAVAGAAKGSGSVFGSLFTNGNWARLLPTTKHAWAIPIFVKLLAFGEAMPLIVERMALSQPSSSSSSSDTHTQQINGNANGNSNHRLAGFRKVKAATVLGAAVPLLLAIIWAGISVALIEPSSANPMMSLLSYGPSIALPVMFLAYGAIGTTLLGAFLAMGHFCQDMICSKLGYCSMTWMTIANVLTVMIPCALASFGSSLYLPLLAFAGAYPTTLLYGLAPSLAALKLRKRAQRKLDELKNSGNDSNNVNLSITPHLVPGGKRTMIAMAATALGLVGASTLRAGRFFVKAVA